MEPCRINLAYFLGLAIRAGRIMKENFRLGMTKTWKADETPITKTDNEINDLVIQWMARDFPDVRVLGEERSSGPEESDWAVLCDPVDGTSPFSTGIPTFCFIICLLYRGQPMKACIYDPIMDRMYTAEKGRGAYLNDKRIYVSDKNALARSNVGVCSRKGCDYNMEKVTKLVLDSGAQLSRPMSIGYWAALLAAGEIEATIFPFNQVWETAAIKLLVEEAGGRVTDIFGEEEARYDGKVRGHLATNGLLHEELARMTRRANGLS